MIWDRLAPFYDMFEAIINGKCNKGIAREITNHVGKNDVVLECACGTGLLTVPMAKKCKKLIATDYSVGMLKRAQRKVKNYSNTKLEQASILELPYAEQQFDVVVAANVIHLLDNPAAALNEMKRVCKAGGKIIIPTYINETKKDARATAKISSGTGVEFKKQFNLASYKSFFKECGISDIAFHVVDGRIPCAFAIFENR